MKSNTTDFTKQRDTISPFASIASFNIAVMRRMMLRSGNWSVSTAQLIKGTVSFDIMTKRFAFARTEKTSSFLGFRQLAGL
jgi:hypothetical protein